MICLYSFNIMVNFIKIFLIFLFVLIIYFVIIFVFFLKLVVFDQLREFIFEELEDKWDDIFGELFFLIQGRGELFIDVVLFDAVLEVDIDY